MSDGVRILHRGEVPILSFAPDKSDQLESLLAASLEKLGFLLIDDHGVDLKLLDRCYARSEEFFALPLEAKNRLLYSAIDQGRYGNIGYFPFREEKAVSSKVPDLKEFFHVGLEGFSERMKGMYVPNVWPGALPELRADFVRLYAQFQALADRLFRMIAHHFGVPRDYADALVREGNSILRTIHYPPVGQDIEVGAVRAAQHTGIHLLGFQPRTSHPGLQFWLPSREWVALDHTEFADTISVNVGDMLGYLLQHRVTPTLHRVVNAMSGSEHVHRYCIVFFYHANSVETLRSYGAGGATGESLLVGQWLMKRLEEIGYSKNHRTAD